MYLVQIFKTNTSTFVDLILLIFFFFISKYCLKGVQGVLQPIHIQGASLKSSEAKTQWKKDPRGKRVTPRRFNRNLQKKKKL